LQAADFVTNFDLEPQVAMLSYSNFGSAEGKSPEKIRKALQIIREKAPKLIIDGEMQADTAVEKSILTKDFPFSVLKDEANTLIFPDLNSGNIAYKLLARIGGANVIGPVLQGLEKSVHILQRGSDVNQILDMVAIAVVDANHKGDKCVDIFK
jgi:malate dehydrogenase (oxaloacetate-decarboxylating)(NADP+)